MALSLWLCSHGDPIVSWFLVNLESEKGRLIFGTTDVWQNARRDRMVAALGMTPEESVHQGSLNAESDMTDLENIHFRYSY